MDLVVRLWHFSCNTTIKVGISSVGQDIPKLLSNLRSVISTSSPVDNLFGMVFFLESGILTFDIFPSEREKAQRAATLFGHVLYHSQRDPCLPLQALHS